jgi:hypothetical protein
MGGTNQLSKPSIIAGMTMNEIMVRPCGNDCVPELAIGVGNVLQPRMRQRQAHDDQKSAASGAGIMAAKQIDVVRRVGELPPTTREMGGFMPGGP